MIATDQQNCPQPADLVYSHLLRSLHRREFIVTSCDRRSGFIAAFCRSKIVAFGETVSILIEAVNERNCNVLVCSMDYQQRGFFPGNRNRNNVHRVFELLAEL